MSEAIERELRMVRDLAHAPCEPRLGCSTISHDRLGFCAGCIRGDVHLELVGWRLLAIQRQRPHIANRNAAGFSCSCGFTDPGDCPVESGAQP